MPISFPCPGCKKTLKVADHLAGKKAKCPGCQTPLTIPMPAAPKATPQDDLFELAPLDDELPKATVPKPTPAQASAAKPQAAAPAKPAGTPNKTAAPPSRPVVKPVPAPPEDLFLAPLEDDLFGSPSQPKSSAKPVAPKSSAAATPQKTSARPAPKPAIPEDEEQNFNLLPLADLAPDLLSTADPLGHAAPLAGTVPAAGSTNPYLAPQTLSSTLAVTDRLPIWRTTRECLKKYSENLNRSIVFGFKAMGVQLVLAGIAYAALFLLGKFFETARPDLDTAMIIFWSVIVALGVVWFIAQCWLVKGLLYFGYSVAREDYTAADTCLESPGSLMQFILASILNTAVILVLSWILGTIIQGTHWGMVFPVLLILSLVANGLGISLLVFFEFEANCLTIFDYWKRIVAPHFINYSMMVILATIIGLVVQSILIFGVAMGYAAVQLGIREILPDDPRVAQIIIGLMFYAVVFGICGTYYSIMQGVAFRRMLKIYRGHDED
jgi:hypothetical protein